MFPFVSDDTALWWAGWKMFQWMVLSLSSRETKIQLVPTIYRTVCHERANSTQKVLCGPKQGNLMPLTKMFWSLY